jgi:hypothetical protein
MSQANTNSQQPNAPSTQLPEVADSSKQNQVTNTQCSQNRPSVPGGRRKRRSTEVSISGLDSGTESDFPRPELKKLKLNADTTNEKSKKRKRKRKTLLTAFSLTK